MIKQMKKIIKTRKEYKIMFGSLFFIFWGPWAPLGAPGPPKIEFYRIFIKIIKNPLLFVALPGPASITIFGFPVVLYITFYWEPHGRHHMPPVWGPRYWPRKLRSRRVFSY